MHRLTTLRTLFRDTFLHVRSHGREALPVLLGFSFVLMAEVAGVILAALRYVSFSEGGDPAGALKFAAIAMPLIAAAMVTGFANWAWVIAWARKRKGHLPAFRAVALKLLGLYIAYKLVTGLPGVVLGAVSDEQYVPVIQILMMLWVLFVLSRGAPALLFVARDNANVSASIRKSMTLTATTWPQLAVRLATGWLAVAVAVVAVIALAVVARVYIDIPAVYTVVIGAVILVVVSQAVMVLSASFLLRLAESAEH